MPRASAHTVTRRLATHNTSRGRHFAANLCAVLVSIFTFSVCSSRSAAASIVVQSSSHTHPQKHIYSMQCISSAYIGPICIGTIYTSTCNRHRSKSTLRGGLH
jgi:hypothetical protein